MFTARAAVSSAAGGAVLAQAASAAKLAAMTTSFRMLFIGSHLGPVLLDDRERTPCALQQGAQCRILRDTPRPGFRHCHEPPRPSSRTASSAAAEPGP